MSKKLSQLKANAKREGWADWIRSEADERAVHNGCTFDQGLADHAADFFPRYLRHSKGEWAGKPFELQPWQRDEIIMPLFGWVRANGKRRFRCAYVEMGKKNGKSTLAAGIGLYMLVGDGEQGAECYSLATKRDQAGIVHGEAVRMVKASAELLGVLSLNASTKNIAYPATASWYRALSSEALGEEGANMHCGIIDEFHAWDHGRKLYDAFRYAGAARRQPFLFIITTAGEHDERHICFEEHEYARQVLSGDIRDQEYLPYIRAAEPADDWRKLATWKKANPSLGVVIQADEMRSQAQKVKQSPALLPVFQRYRLSLWVQQSAPFIHDWQAWKKCGGKPQIPDGAACSVAGDLSTTRDLCALVLCYKDDENVYHLVPYCWLPGEAGSMNDKRNRALYRQWFASKRVVRVPGRTIDYRLIREKIVELDARYKIPAYGFDPWNLSQLMYTLEEEDGLKVVKMRQGWGTMSEPTKKVEELYLSGRLRHGNHPVLNWCFQNLAVKADDNNNVRPTKPLTEASRKVDVAVAAIMAIGMAMRQPKPKTSKYETQGLQAVTG